MDSNRAGLTVATALAEAVRMLVDGLRPQRIYLFGSRARGDATTESDYDLIVVLPASAASRYERARQAFDVLYGSGIPIDVLVFTRDEFERLVPIVASLPATVLREGRLLYAA